MKTLRVLRNVAALFILGMGLLASRSAAGLAPGATADRKFCFIKLGRTNCTIAANGHCNDTECKPGQPCADVGCVDVDFDF